MRKRVSIHSCSWCSATLSVLAFSAVAMAAEVAQTGAADTPSAAERCAGIDYAASCEGYVAKLVAVDYMPVRFDRPDSTVPFAFPFRGPTPFSRRPALLVVTVVADLSVEISTEAGDPVAVFAFEQVAAGPYAADFTGPDLVAGKYRVRILFAGEGVGEGILAYFGPV